MSYERHQLTTLSAQHTESGPRLGWRISLIHWRREPSINGLGSIPLLSAHLLLRRLAALKSVSLAHVTGFASSDSAAALICSRSSSVMGICIPSVLRSLGFLGGLPRLFSMRINIYRINPLSTIAMHIKSVHNKTRQRKTPMQSQATATGQLKPAFADSSLST